MSLIDHYKNNDLVTTVGEFKYKEKLGQSANAMVLSFTKGSKEFAVKFLQQGDKRKLARFQDEYFCAVQLGTHKHVAHLYHFDQISVEGQPYSIIISKRYASNLKTKDSIAKASDAKKAELGWRLWNALANGLAHLHNNHVIHRDIKPENIFYDDANDVFVIGDLGIAHFSDDFKESETKIGERLANFQYSAPEQCDKHYEPVANCDIYAAGQVLSWYLFNITIRGDGREQYNGDNAKLKILDKIIHRCVQNNPAKRFQSIAEIEAFESYCRKQKRDVFARLDDLDEVIRSSLPKINEIYVTSNKIEINRFLNNFNKLCLHEEFWWMDAEGGDNTLTEMKPIDEHRWLFQNHYEVKITHLVCYKHSSQWKSLFILLLDKDDLFPWVDFDGTPVPHPDVSEWPTDYAMLFRGSYIKAEEFSNGYYEHDGQVFQVLTEEAQDRERYLQPYAYMIVPRMTGPDRCPRNVNEALLKDVLSSKSLEKSGLQKYLSQASNYTSREILEML